MTGCPVPPTGGSRPNPSEYDYRLIQARLEELRALRRRGEVARLVFCLHEGLHGNLGNIASPALYSQCRFGTKRLLTEYLDEIAVALDYLCDYEPPAFPPADKLRFFERTAQSFGRSALMLSGGATLGLFHLGVIKAVWSEGLMPRVISGSSAGSIAGAMLGTHTDTELARISCSMADQSYSGDITIVPPTWPSNLLNVFSNPSPARIAEFIQTGEQATWPKLERIRNATRISRAFEHCLERLRVRFALPAAADQAPRHDVA